MIGLGFVYVVGGRRIRGLCYPVGGGPRAGVTRCLWALLAISFLFGDWLGDLGNGVLVAAIVAVARLAHCRAEARRTRGRSMATACSPSH